MQIAIQVGHVFGVALEMFRQQILGMQGIEHALLLAAAIMHLALKALLVRQASGAPRFDIARKPETRERGQIVSGARYERLARIFSARPERSLAGMLFKSIEAFLGRSRLQFEIRISKTA